LSRTGVDVVARQSAERETSLRECPQASGPTGGSSRGYRPRLRRQPGPCRQRGQRRRGHEAVGAVPERSRQPAGAAGDRHCQRSDPCERRRPPIAACPL